MAAELANVTAEPAEPAGLAGTSGPEPADVAAEPAGLAGASGPEPAVLASVPVFEISADSPRAIRMLMAAMVEMTPEQHVTAAVTLREFELHEERHRSPQLNSACGQ